MDVSRPSPGRRYDAGAAFEQVAAMCRDYVVVAGVDGTVLYANPAAQTAFDLDRDCPGLPLSALSLRFPILGPLESLCHRAAADRRALSERIDPFTVTLAPLAGPDGGCEALIITVQIAGPSGELLTAGLQSRVAEQNAALRAARSELAETESRLRMAIEATGLGAWGAELRPSVRIDWSDQMRALYGIAPGEEITLERILAAIHPEDRADVETALEKSLDPRGDGKFAAEHRVCRQDGSVAWVLNWACCVFEGPPRRRRPIRLAGFALDVTDRAGAERERARLVEQIDMDRALLRAVVDQMPAGVIVAEAPSGRILLANAEVERSFGQPTLPAPRTEQYRHWNGVHPNGAPYELEDWPLARTLATGRAVLNQEVVVERPGGEQRVIAVSSSPIVDGAGSVSAVVVVDHDITEQKRIESMMLRYARRQEALASLSNAALAGGDIAPLYARAALLIRETLGVELSFIAERLSDESRCVVRASAGWPEPLEGIELSCPRPGSERDCLCSDEPRVLGDMAGDIRCDCVEFLSNNRVEAGVVVPIRSVDRRFGTLGVFSRDKRSFTVDEIGFLSSVANVVAMAIQRRREEELEARKSAAILRTLNTIGDRPGLESILVNVLAHLKELLRCRSAGFWLYDRTTHAMSLHLTVTDRGVVRGAEPGHPGEGGPISVEQLPAWPKLRQSRQPLWIELEERSDMPFRDWYLSQGIVAALIIPMLLGEETVGWIVARCDNSNRFAAEELTVAQSLAQQAALAIYMERLAEQGRRAAVLEERNRMAREIHDTLAQGFTGIALQLEAARHALGKSVEDAREIIATARDLARQNLAEARRSVWALRPQLLEGAGLPEAFQQALETVTRGTGMEARFHLHGTPRILPGDVEHDTLRIGIEAVTNAVKHSGGSAVDVDLTYDTWSVRLSVRDDGAGFDPARVTEGSFGITSMRERAGRLGGTLHIVSSPGRSTRIDLNVSLLAQAEVSGDNGREAPHSYR